MKNELYDTGPVTGALFGISLASKLVFKDQLAVPSTLKRVLKLSARLTASFTIIQLAKRKKIVPDDPFK